MTIDIHTSDYVRSHGTQPKGCGIWGFNIKNARDNRTIGTIFTPSMAYSDAKVWIKACVRANFKNQLKADMLDVYVAP